MFFLRYTCLGQVVKHFHVLNMVNFAILSQNRYSPHLTTGLLHCSAFCASSAYCIAQIFVAHYFRECRD